MATTPKMSFNRITLAFPRDDEKTFMEKYFHDSVTQVRIAYVACVILYATYAWLDQIMFPDLAPLFHSIRFIFVIPALSIIFALSFVKKISSIWQILVALAFIVAGVGMNTMLIYVPDSIMYYFGMIEVFMAGYLLLKLRFIWASIAGWTITLIFNIGAIVMDLPTTTLISVNSFFIATNIIGMISAYTMEYYTRRDFMQNLNLESTIYERTKELIIAKDKAEESDRLKTSFLQNMSHEIRTPMNAIMGFSSLLPEYFEDKENLHRFSTIINQRCNDLLDIINDLLDIAKIESGQSNVKMEECNLKELFAELDVFFDDYRKRMNKPQITISLLPLPSNDVVQIITDKGKLKQILINLIGNALKFTKQGSIECGYKLNDNNQLQFYVSDTGVGIPKEKHNYIFERFAQLDRAQQLEASGTGLGLPIVKGLVGLLGGEVWLESECGKGTTFFFTINHIKLKTTKTIHTAPETNKIFNLSNRPILIVEDDTYNAIYLNNLLEKLGLNVSTVKCGHDAVEFVQKRIVDVVLMDIRLPDITGYEATSLILQSNPNIKVIAQTAYVTSDERQKALDAGCVDYISKPIKKENLLALLKKYLGSPWKNAHSQANIAI